MSAAGAPDDGTLLLRQRVVGRSDRLVMAIVNRTPDSFYDRGSTWALDRALERVTQAVAAGADIVDIGGVKAGHGPPVDEAEEIERVVPLVRLVRQRWPEVIVSVDTWRAGVARRACEAGADLLNDAWGGTDPQLARVAAEFDVALVCTHTAGIAPRTNPHRIEYDDVVADVVRDCSRLAQRALDVGVDPRRIIVDPAHDFAKTTAHSLEVTRRLGELVALGWPVLVSVSRKDFVGETLDLPTDERLPGTLAATVVAAWLGARIHRVHDVAAVRQALDMTRAIAGDAPPLVAVRGLR
ncbi:dihydropteroate synthase [Kineosphaera limosa]|uniref:Dihydropteroate synthase n=1 Tax=Kineosphaera limosa NBRC 100340 TaxID=1184609 RepID=K6WUE8_9MICO|nr:dihydropteroate synthase [Kineosphaera limosa]NYE01651.1 dihydropteroate synthase [Kineosphaera limosa]GAB97456.1 dihydropteroate synthase [Kineosphaera limosa NBRC 100340]